MALTGCTLQTILPIHNPNEGRNIINANFICIEDNIQSTTGSTGDITRIQPGTNIATGGTGNLPVVNLSDDVVINSLSATTISAQTIHATSIGGFSPTTLVTNMEIADGFTIDAASGGGQLNLRVGADNDIAITTDDGVQGEQGIYMVQSAGYFVLFEGGYTRSIELNNTADDIAIYNVGGDGTNIQLGVKTGAAAYDETDEIKIANNASTPATTGNNDKQAVIIGARNATFAAGVTNSVIIGGLSPVATQDDTAYLPNVDAYGAVSGGTSGGVAFYSGGTPLESIFATSTSNIANTNLTLDADRVHDLNSFDLTFTGGSIGVGTAAPASLFHVSGGAARFSNVVISTGSNISGAGSVTANNFISNSTNGYGVGSDSATGMRTLFQFGAALYASSTEVFRWKYNAGSDPENGVELRLGDFYLTASGVTTNGGLLDSPKAIFRANYDSNVTSGVTATAFGAHIQHMMLTSGATPTSRMDYAINDVNIATMLSSGEVGVGTIAPTDMLHISGITGSTQLRLEESHTPSSSGDTSGNIGSIAWDNDYWYVKTNTGWGRTSLDYSF